MLKLIDNILDLVITTKSNRKYKELQENPEEAAQSTYFGKKFIGAFIGGVIMAVIALVLAFLAYGLRNRDADLGSIVLFPVLLICMAGAFLFSLYAILFILTRLKYVRWQRKLNDLPIGKRARIYS
ncbi:MAG: hypothetical protein K2N74_00985, partial [Clostridiales bacterium]|nr:hypothetical protein [Clostridiales bacterium]